MTIIGYEGREAEEGAPGMIGIGEGFMTLICYPVFTIASRGDLNGVTIALFALQVGLWHVEQYICRPNRPPGLRSLTR